MWRKYLYCVALRIWYTLSERYCTWSVVKLFSRGLLGGSYWASRYPPARPPFFGGFSSSGNRFLLSFSLPPANHHPPPPILPSTINNNHDNYSTTTRSKYTLNNRNSERQMSLNSAISMDLETWFCDGRYCCSFVDLHNTPTILLSIHQHCYY